MKTLIWGIGKQYSHYVNLIRYFEVTHQITVLGVTDRSFTKSEGTIDGYDVYAAERVSALDADLIIVMSDKYYLDILDDISRYGLDRYKAINCRILDIPGIDLNEYMRLKQSRISIISNNCWGGLVYRTLGMECLSPFKNLFLEDEDYLKLVNKPEKYLSSTPCFDHETVDIHSQKRYPVLRLDDVFLHCNHSDNLDKAIEDWNRRRKKINYDNLFFEMYSSDRVIIERFAENCKTRLFIGFTDHETRKQGIETLTLRANEELWEAVLNTARPEGIYLLTEMLLNGTIKNRYEMD